MPEGDTIFRTARALHRALAGKPIVYFDSSLAMIAQSHDQTPFTGETVTQVESRGKWLLIHIGNSEAAGSQRILATHMLMSGSWHLYQPNDPWQERDANARIILEVADYQAVGFRIPVAKIYTRQTLLREKKIPKEDRDVLHAGFDAKAAADRLLARSNDELGDAILRQEILAGVGNVFKSEICFALKLNPFRKVSTLTRRQAKQIVETAQKLLAANVLEDSGGQIVTYTGKGRRTTRNAEPGDNLYVYGRKGEPCRVCQTPVQRALQGRNARSTYWCPHCQPL